MLPLQILYFKYFIASILPYHMKRWSFMGSLAQAKGLYKKR